MRVWYKHTIKCTLFNRASCFRYILMIIHTVLHIEFQVIIGQEWEFSRFDQTLKLTIFSVNIIQ
jgi:hypothetical protein